MHSRQFDQQRVNEAAKRLPDDAWVPFEVTDDYIRSWAFIDVDGETRTVVRKQFLADDLLQAANTEEFNASEGRRWGDGKVVARIPLNVLYDPAQQIAQKLKEGDREHLTWWLNNERNKPFRTFRGRV